MSKISKRNRILAAALGFVATTGACGAFGTFALFGDETSATSRRQIVVQTKNGEREAPSGRKAFLVAADDYGDAATALACTKNDVEALAARLVEIGFDANDVVILKTGGSFRDYPTKANVEARFAAFVKSLRPGDFAIVYLSGHGVQPTDSKEAFFAPIDVDPSDIYGSAVSINDMLDALEKSDATFRWAIVDACRNDPEAPTRAIFTTKTAGAKGLVEVADAPNAIMLLQSCQPGDFSYEGGVGKARDVKNGFFTLSLLEALDSNDPKADADGDGSLMFTEVVKYVTARTNELAFDYYGKSQKPNLCGSITDFPLLDELRIGGLTVGERERADGLYREACALRRGRQYQSALSKIREALALDAANEDYLAEKADIEGRLKDQADAERLKREKEEAEKARAEAERKAEEARRQAQNTGSGSTSGSRIVGGGSSSGGTSTGARRQAENSGSGSTSGSRIVGGGSSSGRTSTGTSANGAWSGEYAEGTAKSLTIEGETYTFHYCPTGSFTMGGGGPSPHTVYLDGFWMLETEVTQAMWKSVMWSNPSWFSSSGGGSSKVSGMDTSNFPVEQVRWNECKEFIARLNSLGVAPSGFKFRLPSEAEWEYACRAGSRGDYAGSSLDSLGWYDDNSGGRTHQVATKSANPWGLYDMHGNVREWCEDWYDIDYYEKPNNARNPINATTGSNRVVRGGGWGDGAERCRSAERSSFGPTYRCNSYFGFRLALVRLRSSR